MGTADLIVIVPSRSRPHNIVDLMDSWAATTTGAVDLLLVTDDDDPAQYPALTVPGWHEIGPRLRLGPTLNLTAVANCGDYQVVGFMGDDHRPRTVGWDRLILDTAQDIGTGVVYGNDLVHGEGLPTAAFLTADLISGLGYMCPPGLTHMYLDNAWKAFGSATALRYLPHMVIEHMHPIVGKAPPDQGYVEVEAFMEPDRIAFDAYMAGQFHRDIARFAPAPAR